MRRGVLSTAVLVATVGASTLAISQTQRLPEASGSRSEAAGGPQPEAGVPTSAEIPTIPGDASGTNAPDEAAARWLAEVAPLITPAERAAYLALTKPYQRQAFEKKFWDVRDPFPETPVNEFAVRWQERAPLARQEWGSLDDARALAFALLGEPAAKVTVTCAELLRPAEIWRFGGTRRGGGSVLVFVAEGFSRTSRYRAWRPREGIFALATSAGGLEARDLLERVARDCGRGAEIASLLSVASDWQETVEHARLLPRTNDEWLLGFTMRSTDLPGGAAELPATLELRFPGRRGLRTLVEGSIRLEGRPAEGASFALDGEIVREEELFDRFRYRYQAAPEGAPEFVFERPLRPGRYRLVLRFQEVASDRYFRVERELVVPFSPDAGTTQVAAATPAAPSAASESASPAAPHSVSPVEPAPEPLPDRLPEMAELRLRVSTGRLVTGKLRLDADVKGPEVAAVAFSLDGKPVLTKRRPPFGVELDLGRAPRLHRVGAVALDAAGRELAKDEQLLNGGPHRFALRLVEPTSIPIGAERVTARAELDLPEGEKLERVEFFVNNRLHATLYQEPFEQSLPVPSGLEPSWLRAVGHLVGGGAAEDVRLVGAGEYATAVEVDFVEIHASIVDRRGRTIEDVRPDEVVLEEAGDRQEIKRFELLRDLPIHAAVMIDTSASMAEELEEAERAALRFFGEVLTDRDRAAVVTFAEEPRLAVRFTRSIEVLAGGLAGLEAYGETKIWDALAYTLHYFSGIRGKRALVLLTDGVDSSSRYPFRDVLEYAKRTGVAIYTVGINVPRYPPDAGMYLDQLAHQTGGRTYRIDRAVALGPIYETIERELRSQYLIAYQSNHGDGDAFRPIEIDVKRPGAQVNTIAGYYP